MKPVLAVDFDLTICSDSRFGDPMPGAADAIPALRSRYRVVVHTCKANTDTGAAAVAEWLGRHGIYVDGIHGKLEAVEYLDDKGTRFTAWADYMQGAP